MNSSLPLLLETIKIEDGKIDNLSYHQKRLTKSQKELYGVENIELKKHISAPTNGLYRCRILYDKKLHNIEYIPYTPKNIVSLKMVNSDIEYAYKYANRDSIDTLLKQIKGSYDEIIIVKDGYITDTSIANIAFYDGVRWLTPKNPLLKGTMRQNLIENREVEEKEIKVSDISNYTQVALMNAMIGFKILKNITIEDTKGKIYDY